MHISKISRIEFLSLIYFWYLQNPYIDQFAIVYKALTALLQGAGIVPKIRAFCQGKKP